LVKLPGARTQTRFHIAETFPKGEPAKGHAEKLVPAGEGFDLVVPGVTTHTAPELLRVDQVRELGEN